jgi:hypothetical protein
MAQKTSGGIAMNKGVDTRTPFAVWLIRVIFLLVLGNEIRMGIKLWERATMVTAVVCIAIILTSIMVLHRTYVRRRGSLYFIATVVVLLPLWFFVGFNTMAVRLSWSDWLVALPLQMLLPGWLCFHLLTAKGVKQFFSPSDGATSTSTTS